MNKREQYDAESKEKTFKAAPQHASGDTTT